MTTTFAGVILPNASKVKTTFDTLTKVTVLLSGKRSVQTNPEVGMNFSVTCLGTRAQFLALLALVGTKDSLVTDDDTYTNCAMNGNIDYTETDDPDDQFFFSFGFVRETI
jgi:hypothetical protein